jgi:hypothetical protein
MVAAEKMVLCWHAPDARAFFNLPGQQGLQVQ